MDIGKYKYDLQKKANLAKKKQKTVSLKEIKLRPGTEAHDYNFKIKNAKKFIKELGNPYSKIVVDPSGVNSIELGAYGVPETILINNTSKTILKKYIGPLDDKKLGELKMIIKNEN